MASYGYYTDDYSAADFYHDLEYNAVSSIPFHHSFPQYSSWDDEFDHPPAPSYSVFTEPEPISYSPSIEMGYDYSSNGFLDYDSANAYGGYYSVYQYTEPESVFYSPSIEMGYDYSSNGFLDYDSANRYGGYYSVYHYAEPKLLQHDPAISAEEFNAPEFKKYNPKPYSGGYDPITTYGSPLPPSDEICYPRPAPRSDVAVLSEVLPHGKDSSPKKIPTESRETDKKTNDEALKPVSAPVPLPIVDSPGRNENQKNGDYGHISGPQMVQVSYGSGLEAVDICDTIFGYWPCLAKLEKQKQLLREKVGRICDQESGKSPWEIAADYLFGSPLVYSRENLHSQQSYQSWSFEEW